MLGQLSKSFRTVSASLSESQTSPRASPSKFVWSALALFGQLSWGWPLALPLSTPSPSGSNANSAFNGKASEASSMPSLSSSRSQALPTASPSEFSWLALSILMQLSEVLSTPSLSISMSQASPSVSPSISDWLVLASKGQLSRRSTIVSPSVSISGGRRLIEIIWSVVPPKSSVTVITKESAPVYSTFDI